MVEPHSSNFRVITTNFLGVRKLRVITVSTHTHHLFSQTTNSASSWDYGTYHICNQRRLRRACASAQFRQSLRCSHTWNIEVDEGSYQTSVIQPHWMALHVCLKNEFTEDEKCHNLMTWLNFNWKEDYLWTIFEPPHEIMALFVLPKLILQMRMHSHQVGLDVWFLVGLSSTSILHVCEEWRLWRDCVDAQARLSRHWSPMW